MCKRQFTYQIGVFRHHRQNIQEFDLIAYHRHIFRQAKLLFHFYFDYFWPKFISAHSLSCHRIWCIGLRILQVGLMYTLCIKQSEAILPSFMFFCLPSSFSFFYRFMIQNKTRMKIMIQISLTLILISPSFFDFSLLAFLFASFISFIFFLSFSQFSIVKVLISCDLQQPYNLPIQDDQYCIFFDQFYRLPFMNVLA